MENENIKLLSLLSMGFTEDFFKEKIGTGSDIRELEEKGIIIKNNYLYTLKNSREIYININKEEKEKFLNDIINSYYSVLLKESKELDLNSIIDKLLLILQLSSAYYELEKYDLAIENISNVAKKMVYWGMKDEIKMFLSKFDIDQINLKNKKWKEYLLVFSDIVIGYDTKLDKDKIEMIFSNYQENNELGFEIRNLKAIYTRKYKKDIDSAIIIHKENIENMKSLINNNGDENLNIQIGRNYENLSICYKILGDLDDAVENIGSAAQYIEKCNDNYELCKYYCNVLNIVVNTKKYENMFLKYSEYSLRILKEFNYPDLLRSVKNLFADYFLQQGNNIEEYINLKIDVFKLDAILYKEFFVMDFIGMLNTFSNEFYKSISKDSDNLNLLIQYLRENEFLNESYIIECIQRKAKDEKYDMLFEKIDNRGLKKIFKMKFDSI